MKKLTFILALLVIGTTFSFGQLRVVTNGDVGIGTTTPASKLEVTGFVTLSAPGASNQIIGGSNDKRLVLTSGQGSLNSYSYFSMFGDETQTGGAPARAGEFSLAGNYISIRSNVDNTGFGQEAVRITAARDVGIKTAAPAYTLHVNGTAGKPGGGDWAAASDRQLKENINAYNDGLASIMSINPVTYEYNGKGGIDTGDKEFVGVIAQELKEVAPYMVQPYIYKDINPETNEVIATEEYLAVDPSAITYMLVNAVQEQQEIIEEKDAQIEKLEDRLERLERAIFKGEAETGKTETNVSIQGKGSLEQNTPNPFSGNTTIKFETTSDNAEIQIFSLTGELLKVVAADGRTGQVNVQISDMPAGTYSYSLVANGKVIDTKKMVLTK